MDTHEKQRSNEDQVELTDRQRRELEYHRGHAALATHRAKALSLDIVTSKERRWWNGYWSFYTEILKLDITGKRTLVVGCGFGDDTVRLAHCGADVYGFDLSPESIDIARKLTESMGKKIDYRVSPAENMPYDSKSFDVVVVHDILHHVDIPKVLSEIVRVAKPGALFLCSEVYTHAGVEKFRRSSFIHKLIYPIVRKQIYATSNPYITEDERKINHHELAAILGILKTYRCKYFYFIAQRFISERHNWAAKLDQIFMSRTHGKLGQLLAGRVQIFGYLP
jgi:ubiquinone/menaquinone biosynthesis C-methylase UbiE